MSLGTGVNKEQYLVFLCGYLVVFSLILSFVCATMNTGLIVTPISLFTVSSGDALSVSQYFANVGNLFSSFISPFPVDTRIIDMPVQVIFLYLPKFAILVVLLSYIKDMIP